MTPEELDAMDAKEKAATPGPWRNSEEYGHASILVGEGSLICHGPDMEKFYCQDLDFIAASRDFVPKAIAEIRRLRSEKEALRAPIDPDREQMR